jgi:hypothetical protein
VWGQLPATLLINPDPPDDPTHEAKLLVSGASSGNIGPVGDKRAWSERQMEVVKPPLGKKWLVCNCVFPASVSTAQEISDLQDALEGITGVTSAYHLIGGTMPTDVTQGQVSIEVRMRIDPIEV